MNRDSQPSCSSGFDELFEDDIAELDPEKDWLWGNIPSNAGNTEEKHERNTILDD